MIARLSPCPTPFLFSPAVALVFGFILMPLWPDCMKQGVSYTGWLALGLLAILLIIELRKTTEIVASSF
jgi:hypothetical protein